ncbi:MAG: class I SAM-dependent methyltransferase, partial [Bacteroidota bacterium]
MKAWFEEWFDSPFYFELYQNRSDSEAKLFIEGILHRISLDANASILDVCCGKGRHSKVLAAQGFQVTGIDISEQSIVEARNLKISNAEFILADARNFNLKRQFDCSLNLFTSFGYFESIEEHEQMLSRIALHTKPGGYFILDFL